MDDLDVFFVDDLFDWFEEDFTSIDENSDRSVSLEHYQLSSLTDISNHHTLATAADEEKERKTNEENNTSSSMEGAKPAPRKRKRIRKRLPPIMKKPKLSKDDPRKFLLKKSVDAYNSADPNEVWNFMEKNTSEDIVYRDKAVGDLTKLPLPIRRCVTVQGREGFFHLWCAFLVLVPDGVIHVNNAKLYLRSDGTSTIVAAVVVHGSSVLSDDAAIKLQDSALDSHQKESDKAMALPSVDKQRDAECAYERVLSRIGTTMNDIMSHFHLFNESNATSKSSAEQPISESNSHGSVSHPLAVRSSENTFSVSRKSIEAVGFTMPATTTYHIN